MSLGEHENFFFIKPFNRVIACSTTVLLLPSSWKISSSSGVAGAAGGVEGFILVFLVCLVVRALKDVKSRTRTYASVPNLEIQSAVDLIKWKLSTFRSNAKSDMISVTGLKMPISWEVGKVNENKIVLAGIFTFWSAQLATLILGRQSCGLKETSGAIARFSGRSESIYGTIWILDRKFT